MEVSDNLLTKLQKLDSLTREELIKKAKKYGPEKLSSILRILSDAYYNTGQSLVSDRTFDIMRDVLEEIDPNNSFLSEVGAKVTKNKVVLPYQMSSLHKKTTSEEVDRWINKFGENCVVSDKLDGVSAQIYKDNEGNVLMFTRGNGIEGTDITHLLPYTKIDTSKIPNNTSVRGELIISIKNFQKISSFMKNARNAVAGLVNSKTVDRRVARITEFIAYSILHPPMVQLKQMKKLQKMGFKVVTYIHVIELSYNFLREYLLERKSVSEYEMDGLVCVDNTDVYEPSVKHPDHAFAFKMMSEDDVAETVVEEVIWEPSMDGYLKPKVRIKPVQLVGTKITYATAYNAKFVVENGLGRGARIKIIRSGDVIPKIIEVIEPADEVQLPDVEHEWNESKVEFVLLEDDDLVRIKRIVYFFKTIGVKHMNEKIVGKLYHAGYNSIFKILKMEDRKEELYEGIPGVGHKIVDRIYDEINKAFSKLDLATLMGASHKFGRGLAIKKLREVLNVYPDILEVDWDYDEMVENIMEVPGFHKKLATLFADNIDEFKKFYHKLNKIKPLNLHEDSEVSVQSGTFVDGLNIVFTGFRDQELKDKIISLGGNVSDSVSRKTNLVVYKDGQEDSTKLKKAINLGIEIMSKSKFVDKINQL